MTFEEIEALVRAAQGRGLASLEFAASGARLAVSFASDDDAAAEAPPAAGSTRRAVEADGAVLSPGVGFLRLRHPAGTPLPAAGETVGAETVVAFIQAGPLLLPVPAKRVGVLGEALVPDGTGVGYGVPLFGVA